MVPSRGAGTDNAPGAGVAESAAADTVDAGQAQEPDADRVAVARPDAEPPRVTPVATSGMVGLPRPDGRHGLESEPLRTSGVSTRS